MLIEDWKREQAALTRLEATRYEEPDEEPERKPLRSKVALLHELILATVLSLIACAICVWADTAAYLAINIALYLIGVTPVLWALWRQREIRPKRDPNFTTEISPLPAHGPLSDFSTHQASR